MQTSVYAKQNQLRYRNKFVVTWLPKEREEIVEGHFTICKIGKPQGFTA